MGLLMLLLTALAIGAAVYVGLAIGGTALVLKYLLTPGKVDWSGAGRPSPSDPLQINYRGDPGTAFGFAFSEVTFATPLGEAQAWLVPATTPSDTWAIYVHGIGGIRENGYKQLGILHEAGLPVLLITYRNDRGAPTGERPLYSFGIEEWADIDAALTYALGKGAHQVVLVADSMGGAIAGQFLRRSPQVDRVVALALDAPALDVRAVALHAVRALRLPFAGLIADTGTALFGRIWGLDLSQAVVTDKVIAFPRPLFLAHGTADRLVPIPGSDELNDARAAPTVYVRSGAEHLQTFSEDPAAYRKGMLDMLQAAGIGAPVETSAPAAPARG